MSCASAARNTPTIQCWCSFSSSRWASNWCSSRCFCEEAHKLGIRVTKEDVIKYLQTGPTGEVLYPNGKFIGEDAYAQLINDRLNMSPTDFERRDQGRHHRPAPSGSHHCRGDGQRPGGARGLPHSEHQDQVRLRGHFGRRPAQDHQPHRQRPGGVLQKERRALRPGGAGRAHDHLLRVHGESDSRRSSATQPAGRSSSITTSTRAIIRCRTRPSRATFSSACPQGADAKTDAAAKAKAETVLKQLQAGGSWTELAKNTLTIRAARIPAASWALRSAARWCRSSTRPSLRRRSATSRL